MKTAKILRAKINSDSIFSAWRNRPANLQGQLSDFDMAVMNRERPAGIEVQDLAGA